jgi:hypothetical protein
MTDKQTLRPVPFTVSTITLRCLLACCGVLLILSPLAVATGDPVSIYTVAPDGLGEYATIQAAIDAVTDQPAVIELLDGTFTGPGNRELTNLDDKEITFRSQSIDAALCIIDFEDHRILAFEGFDTLVTQSAQLVFSHLSLTQGIRIESIGCEISFVDCLVSQCEGLLYSWFSMGVHLTRCEISDCSNHMIDAVGDLSARSYIYDCTFIGNTTATIFCHNVEILDCSFIQNQGRVMGTIYLVMRRCQFVDNQGNNDHLIKGGLDMDMGNMVLDDCLFTNNTGYETVVYSEGSILCERSLFAGNEARSIEAQANEAPVIEIRASTFVGNRIPGESEIKFNDNTPDQGSLTMENCLFAFSTAAAAVSLNPDYIETSVACCNIFGISGGDWVGCLAEFAEQNGNLSLDPLFCGAGESDYSLAEASPCVAENNPDCGQIGLYGVGCQASAIEPSATGLISVSSIDASPNPFTGTTRIQYRLSSDNPAAQPNMGIYDLTGRRIRSLPVRGDFSETGFVEWDGLDDLGRPLSPGVYLCRLTDGRSRVTSRIICLR